MHKMRMIYRQPTRANEPSKIYTDVLSDPGHYLIAGQTRSGKSVILNSIIREMLLDAPCNRQLILIDPKRVELMEYKPFPHCIRYASEPADMIKALDYAMQIADQRYVDMQARHIKKYDGGHVYVIIDELADLMLTNAKDAAPILTRIGQVAAASRVHMIACTQYLLSAVIPTQIKANFTVTIGLHTRNRHESRLIIDESGCEQLPQYGFCMLRYPGRNTVRVKVPYVDDDTAAAEVNRLLQHWTNPDNYHPDETDPEYIKRKQAQEDAQRREREAQERQAAHAARQAELKAQADYLRSLPTWRIIFGLYKH